MPSTIDKVFFVRNLPRFVAKRWNSRLNAQPAEKEGQSRPPTAKPITGRSSLKLYTKSRIAEIFRTYLGNSSPVDPLPFEAAASVLPMRTNDYVLDKLIDWSNIPRDPIFQLVFPQPGMLEPCDLKHMERLLVAGASRTILRREAEGIRKQMNPHPAQQKELNVPRLRAQPLQGMQHKYRETLLFFPSEGQFCHSYCTYCFRWAQFTAVGSAQGFQSSRQDVLRDYLAEHNWVSDLLFTGGDPMVMSAKQWRRYLVPLLNDPRLGHVSSIRVGSKSLAYWPYRFITDPDADDMLRLMESVVQSGRQFAFMAHVSHPRELSTPEVQEAIRRIRLTGANIRAQAPLIDHVNADPVTWADMWRAQVRMGIVPYYMFVERDTGAKHYFEVPLSRALEIYNLAVSSVSGLARTVRGPSMSATPGKVHVVGTTEVNNEKLFILKFLQARNPSWIKRPFFAKYDETSSWLDNLKPAFGDKFFFEDELDEMAKSEICSGNLFPYPEDIKCYGN